jgi:hypothetical protein
LAGKIKTVSGEKVLQYKTRAAALLKAPHEKCLIQDSASLPAGGRFQNLSTDLNRL